MSTGRRPARLAGELRGSLAASQFDEAASVGEMADPNLGRTRVLIETDRLLLRPLTMAYLDELVAMHADPAVVRTMGPLDRPVATERVERYEREWDERGHGLVAVIERATGRFLGRSGLKYWPQFDETEVGWVLRPDAWGHGYAAEAGRACLAWGFRSLDVPYLTAMIRPDNARSIRVAERLGMTVLRADALLQVPVVVHAMRRETWTGIGASMHHI